VTAGLLGLMIPVPAGAQVATTPLTLSAGAETAGGFVQLNAFAPHTVTIAAGDSLTWRVDSEEFHTVSFLAGTSPPPFVIAEPEGVYLNPAATMPSGGATYDGRSLVGSGLLTLGQTYTLSFPQPGTYEYVCLVHPEMKASVVVKPAGEATDTQATVDARRAAEVNAALATHGIGLLMNSSGEVPVEGASAGIAAGTGDAAVMVARFLPDRVTVKAGDAVSWIWKDPGTPHTVTFLDGAPAPDLIVPRPQPGGPPLLELNPVVLHPSGDPTGYAGGQLSSGFVDPSEMPPGSPAPTFTVRFDQPGTYQYVCLLHENMAGTIVVE
jgi:plastocyanin